MLELLEYPWNWDEISRMVRMRQDSGRRVTFLCFVCGRRYISKEKLFMHLDKKHGIVAWCLSCGSRLKVFFRLKHLDEIGILPFMFCSRTCYLEYKKESTPKVVGNPDSALFIKGHYEDQYDWNR